MRIKSNLDEILYDRIIESLISGSYSMGENLTLDELSKKFEVSRTPVVQAVKLLVNDGILCSMSNGRLYVPEYDRQSVLEMCQVRELIEGYALRVFMSGEGASTKQILPRLESYAEQFKLLSNESQYAEFATAESSTARLLRRPEIISCSRPTTGFRAGSWWQITSYARCKCAIWTAPPSITTVLSAP